MAVTHADLEPTTRRGSGIGSKTGVLLMVFSILLGLLCFVLCLMAEATRSQIVREVNDGDGEAARRSGHESCRYSGNGKTPLLCGAAAFLSLAIAMVMQHAHLLLSLTRSDPDHPSDLLIYTWDHQRLNTLTCQAAFFFLATWICFCVGEVLLLIGVSVESGHLKGWWTPRPSCFVAREGLFSSAGILGITTVFLASGLSLRAQSWLLQDQQINNHPHPHPHLMEPSILYSSPPPGHDGEAPIVGHELYHEPGLVDYLTAFDKII